VAGIVQQFHVLYAKSPQGTDLGAFLFPYCEQGLTLRLVAFYSLVKPSAKVVADYPCRDGDKERCNNVLHDLYTSFPCRDEEATHQV